MNEKTTLEQPLNEYFFSNSQFEYWRKKNKINAIALLSQSPPPPRSSPKHILNTLNDDCLCAIFQNFSHLAGFDSISSVCKRFNAIALQVFPSKIQTCLIDIDELVIDTGNQLNFITLAQLWKFLYDFGSSITSLKFHTVYLERTPDATNLALKLIKKFCKNMRSLDIEITAEQDQIPETIYSIFSKQSVLCIKFPQSMPGHDFISACRESKDTPDKLNLWCQPQHFVNCWT